MKKKNSLNERPRAVEKEPTALFSIAEVQYLFVRDITR